MNSFAFMLIQCLLTIDIKTFENSNALQKNGKIIPNWFYAESGFVIFLFYDRLYNKRPVNRILDFFDTTRTFLICSSLTLVKHLIEPYSHLNKHPKDKKMDNKLM